MPILRRHGRICPALAIGLVVISACPAPLAAQDRSLSATAESQTFRRVVVNPNATGPRITVQIDPEEQARLLAAAPPRAQVVTPDRENRPAPASGYAWFWDHVSPALGDSSGRFLAAMRVLGSPPSASQTVRAPRMQFLQDIANTHGADILRATVGTNVSPALALAVIAVESAGRPQAVSHAGAQGLMQLIPATAERFGVSDAFDATQNIRGGVQYLDWLLKHFDNDVVLALAGYNAGEGAVRRNEGVPPFAETRDYVPKVLAAWLVARGLCATVPELPGDGCVFKIGQAG
ncbi:lytic transglycosylase domain-containing protein [Natronohydrobacter thiooxidans]|uniref:lytic transglycosylase domain-containing protein n=1 Tax=Natronohydrobacter thiooxidans TaxID=87172 RepID=UPI0008FF0E5E|nr:lytic transglycosylase domain-containing protein [Natronohydrobacter thiooxidans]